MSSGLTEQQQKLKEIYDVLRPYQVEVFTRMVREHRHLNYLDMGMGKSLATSLTILYTEAFPCIIVCPGSAMGVWEDQLQSWFGEECTMYLGKPKQREAAFKEFATKGHKFIITNYALVEELGARFGVITVNKSKGSSASETKAKATAPPGTKWKVGGLIADEIQLSGLFNHKSQTYGIFKKLAKAIPSVFLLTGTPYRRGVVDFFGPLSLIDPERFKSYWSYVSKYCISINTGFGKDIERNPQDIVAFREMIREYASIMKKEDHLDELPGKQRIPVPIEMNAEQSRVYKELLEEMFAETDSGELIMAPSKLAMSVRERQLLACPQQLGLKEPGAAIETVIEMSESLVEEGKPFVIFTPFKQAVPWISKALKEAYPASGSRAGITIYTISGGLTADEFTSSWKGFQNHKGTGPRVLICVIRSGASFHATCADTCFFIGYEWDFNQNAQAEDRLNRIGQKKLVTCYYPLHRGTIDEHIIQRLNDKKFTSELVLSSEETFRMMWTKMRGDVNET